MNTSSVENSHLRVTVVAHEEQEQRWFLFQLLSKEWDLGQEPFIRVALVLDRSGSMEGEKLYKCKVGAAKLIRSLREGDRIAIVTYDDEVNVLASLGAPSERLASRVEAVRSGNTTNLYGGWLEGVRQVGTGGRVILLSDGLANVGEYVDANELAVQAEYWRREHMVTTTTIGVGTDYDEVLMAGMALSGTGNHYFAHTAADVVEALSQERYLLGAAVIGHCEIHPNGNSVPVGHFALGEKVCRVVSCPAVATETVRITYRTMDDDQEHSLEVVLPKEFAYDEECAIQLQLQRVSDLQTEMLQVSSSQKASELRERARVLLRDLEKHKLADDPRLVAVRDELRRSLQRLTELVESYDYVRASVHRKRAMQMSAMLHAPAHAYSAFVDDMALLHCLQTSAIAHGDKDLPVALDESLLGNVPIEQWLAWRAVPVRLKSDGSLVIAMVNPYDGFTVADISKAVGVRVEPLPQRFSETEITDLLEATKSSQE